MFVQGGSRVGPVAAFFTHRGQILLTQEVEDAGIALPIGKVVDIGPRKILQKTTMLKQYTLRDEHSESCAKPTSAKPTADLGPRRHSSIIPIFPTLEQRVCTGIVSDWSSLCLYVPARCCTLGEGQHIAMGFCYQ